MDLLSCFAEHKEEIAYDVAKVITGTDVKDLPPELVRAIVTVSIASAQAVAVQYNSWLESQNKRRPE